MPFRTYCFIRMPEGLKNTGPTFCRMSRKIFESQISRNVHTYVDDMIITRRKREDHTNDLAETLANLRAAKLKLNLEKCIFGVQKGKVLGCLVNSKGIEANPGKVKEITSMQPPLTIEQVQKLTGRMAALNRSISKSAEKSLPFFKALKGSGSFEWTEEQQRAFEELKEHLAATARLASPEQCEALLLYVSANHFAVSITLVQQRKTRSIMDKNKKEKELFQQYPVYFVSEALAGLKLFYSEMEKICYVVVMAARKLRHYFEAHKIRVLTN